MELEFRELCAKDAPKVAELEAKCFSMPWSEEGFVRMIGTKDALYLTAWTSDRLVGYCGFLQSFEEAEVMNVAVAEEFRGRGAGYCMLSELLRRGQERGVERFILEVRSGNAPALHLYGKLGFAAVGTRRNFYEKPKEDAVIMWKN